MADENAEALLAPLVRAHAVLLRVRSSGPEHLYLYFDRGALEIRAADAALELEWLGAALPGSEAEVLDEAEPWWAVLGQPLQGAWSRTDADGRRVALTLELRAENPKRIALEPRVRRLVARAEPSHVRASEAP